MHQFNNSFDLRANSENISSGDSIWPTFTDIITVILMIFMLTMVFVIVKNSDLLNQLNSVLSKKNIISKNLDKSKKDKKKLKIKMTHLEENLNKKKMEIMLLNEEISLTKSKLNNKNNIISSLNDKTSKLEENLNLLHGNFLDKEKELLNIKKAHQQDLLQLRIKTKKKINRITGKFIKITKKLHLKDKKIASLNRNHEILELDLARQRNEYSKLESKYHKLIKPSRSSAGRVVVTVRYSKKEENFNYFFKNYNSNIFKSLTKTQLNEKLKIVKKKFEKNLYVKIIIPEDSGLSYNEAWTFTSSILKKYDYYYQN